MFLVDYLKTKEKPKEEEQKEIKIIAQMKKMIK